MERDDRAEVLAWVASDLADQPDEQTTTQLIVERAVALIGGSEHASLTMKSRRGFRTLAATSQQAMDADRAQYELREGPCVDSTIQGEWFRSGDVRRDPRWPRWGPVAEGLGMRSLLSIRLLSHDEPFGALNLYSNEIGGFADVDQVELALLYTVHAASALTAAQAVSHLETAMTSRHEIGVAQGILIGRYDLEPEIAFGALRRVSQDTNRKLRDVAAEVIRTRRLPAVSGSEVPSDGGEDGTSRGH